MRKSYVIALISIVFSLCIVRETLAQAKAQYEPSPSEGRDEIGNILVEGNVGISTAGILSKVRSRVGQVFDLVTAGEDAKRIAKLPGVEYSYYNTAIVDNKIQLTFVVGERDIVRSIAFVGNRAYKAGTLRDKLTFKVGDWLDVILAETCRATLVEFYRRKGFACLGTAHGHPRGASFFSHGQTSPIDCFKQE